MVERTALHYQLALLHAPGVGPVKYRELQQRVDSLEQLFLSPTTQFADGKLLHYLQQPDWEAVERDMEWLQQANCHLLRPHDGLYPQGLAEISDAPPLLFLHGNPRVLDNPQLAMVGSRNPSASGRETAHDFARTLAAAGMVITSGLASGIDAASHRGALEGGGHTIAVAGTGLDRVYPAVNRGLAHAIVDQGGAILSEYPPGTPPLAGNFPRRNRIISALSLGTLVVEAALRSGSLITARLASEQGREVFAIPGSIHNPLSRGCHRLIREGAKLVESASDILEELMPQLQRFLAEEAQHEADAGVLGAVVELESELDEEYQRLLVAIGDEPTSVDRMVERSGLTAEAVSSMLLLLELQGFIESTAGGYMRSAKRL